MGSDRKTLLKINMNISLTFVLRQQKRTTTISAVLCIRFAMWKKKKILMKCRGIFN